MTDLRNLPSHSASLIIAVVLPLPLRPLDRRSAGTRDTDGPLLASVVHLEVELHLLSVGERAEALALDAGVVHEEVAPLRLDEAEAAIRAEELHDTAPIGEVPCLALRGPRSRTGDAQKDRGTRSGGEHLAQHGRKAAAVPVACGRN